jgi:hypothetical protein
MIGYFPPINSSCISIINYSLKHLNTWFDDNVTDIKYLLIGYKQNNPFVEQIFIKLISLLSTSNPNAFKIIEFFIAN